MSSPFRNSQGLELGPSIISRPGPLTKSTGCSRLCLLGLSSCFLQAGSDALAWPHWGNCSLCRHRPLPGTPNREAASKGAQSFHGRLHPCLSESRARKGQSEAPTVAPQPERKAASDALLMASKSYKPPRAAGCPKVLLLYLPKGVLQQSRMAHKTDVIDLQLKLLSTHI